MPTEGCSCVAPTEPVGAEWHERCAGPARDLIGQRLQPVARRDDWRVSTEDLRDVWDPWLALRMQSVVTFGGERVVPELLIARNAVDVRRHVVSLLQDVLGAQHLLQDRARAEQRHAPAPSLIASLEEIDAANDPVLDTGAPP